MPSRLGKHIHTWKLKDAQIYDASMAFDIEFRCPKCGLVEEVWGGIEHAEEAERWDHQEKNED